MALFKKKVNVEEDAWREEIKKDALKEARVEAAPKLKEKIKKDEVDRLTGDKKSKFFEKLGKEFKPLGDLATNEKMDRLLGHTNSGDRTSRMLGNSQSRIEVLQAKGRNFRNEMGYDEIKADDRVNRILDKKVIRDGNLRYADEDDDEFKKKIRRLVKS